MSRHREAADRIIAGSHPDSASLAIDADIVANWVVYADACINDIELTIADSIETRARAAAAQVRHAQELADTADAVLETFGNWTTQYELVEKLRAKAGAA